MNLPLLMGDVPAALSAGATMFWPVLTLGIVIGAVVGFFLGVIVTAILKGKP